MSQQLNEYIMETNRKIGRGSSGIVYMGYHRDGHVKVAIKRINISNELGRSHKFENLWNEINIMKSLRHPNIVTLYNVNMDIPRGIVYLIMEYCDGHDLTEYIDRSIFDLEEIQNFMSQIKDGLKYLRKEGIVHRDLKPHNILLHHDTIKIADFGLSVINKNDNKLMKTVCGSPMYMSPEIIEHKKYTTKSDLWSIGIILYQLIYHEHPYSQCRNLHDLTNQMNISPIKYPDTPNLDSLTMDLLQGLLNKDCHYRISWDDFFDHPWFNCRLLNNSISESLIETDIFRLSLSNHESINQSESDVFHTCRNQLDLDKFIIEDYNSNNKKPITSIYSTSGPSNSHTLQYSPGRLNIHSVGSNVLKCVNKSFKWIKSSIEY